MDFIPKIVRKKVAEIFKEHGLTDDPNKYIDKMTLTDTPDNNHWQKVFEERAKYEAKDIEENFYCFICGKKYDHPDDLTECLNDHFIKFHAGIPIERTPEHEEKLVQNLHPKDRPEALRVLRGEKPRVHQIINENYK